MATINPSFYRSCLRLSQRQSVGRYQRLKSRENTHRSRIKSRSPLTAVSTTKPRSLAFQTQSYATASSRAQAVDPASDDSIGHLRPDEIRDLEPDQSEHERAMKTTEMLFKECARHADYFVPEAFERKGEIPKNEDREDIGQGEGWWYDDLGLTPTFNTWAQITFIHMYLLTARMRYFPPQYAQIYLQHFHDHFFYEAEHRMTIFHKITSNMIRQRYLKDLHNQWRGVQGAYDEGLIKGDAVLATAIWRNLWKAKADVDWRQVAMLTSFMRRGLKALDGTKDHIIREAKVKFSGPSSQGKVVETLSEDVLPKLGKEDDEALAEYREGLKKS